ISVLIADNTLYCANEGEPISEKGMRYLLMSHLTTKGREDIGRFGLGFKSVLAVCDHPEVYSRSVSFRFNPPEHTATMAALVGEGESLPKLRTAVPLSWDDGCAQDSNLADLLTWATTVVRLPLREVSVQDALDQVAAFPAAFLVFSPHVSQLSVLAQEYGVAREVTVAEDGDHIVVTENGTAERWRVFAKRFDIADLSEPDRRLMDRRLDKWKSLPMSWALSRAPHVSAVGSGFSYRRRPRRRSRES
ncbi:MAG: hypothetical protein O3A47_07910, partial [Chloroflexi bacterium]|nr:hypothetical protein [Chloroflexota bacterium]